MISIKVKFRASTIPTRIGAIFFQIIQHRVVKQITTSYKIYEHEWNEEYEVIQMNKSAYSRRTYLADIEQKIIRDIDKLYLIASQTNDMVTVIDFYAKSCRESTLFPFTERVANELYAIGRLKTAQSHRVSLRSFSAFREGKDIDFNAITSHLIKQYEHYLKAKSLSNNTISFYMRLLRVVYNRAVNEGLTMQNYPFKGVYVGVDKTIKRAVGSKTISQLKRFDLSAKKDLELSRDLFMFSFYARGMAFVDVAHLTQSHIQNGYIVYNRHKTGQELRIKIESCLMEIISSYKDGTLYLLPILSRYKNYETALRLHNTRLKQISEMMGLDKPLTSYVSRHSWASIAKQKGISTQIISESLGHSNEKTTLIYLALLDSNVIDKANEMLLAEI